MFVTWVPANRFSDVNLVGFDITFVAFPMTDSSNACIGFLLN